MGGGGHFFYLNLASALVCQAHHFATRQKIPWLPESAVPHWRGDLHIV
jgi:hypothetical protein